MYVLPLSYHVPCQGHNSADTLCRFSNRARSSYALQSTSLDACDALPMVFHESLVTIMKEDGESSRQVVGILPGMGGASGGPRSSSCGPLSAPLRPLSNPNF